MPVRAAVTDRERDVAASERLTHPDSAAERYKRAFYPEADFGGFSDHDGTVAFYTRLNAMVAPSSVVVDYGCGRGEHAEDAVEFRRSLRSLKGKVAKVIGLDVDPVGRSNPTIDQFHGLTPGRPWPLPDGCIDLVLCDCVLEHLEEPELLFRESARVLRPEGVLSIRTTNVWSYVGIAAKLVPNRLHAGVLQRVQNIRHDNDVFPTVYRCNTVPALRRQLKQRGFRGAVWGHTAEPSYLSFSRFAFALGVLHQKMAPALFATTLFAFARRTA